MSFVTRRLECQFQLGTGAFGEDGSDTVDLKGLRASANITIAGGSLASLDLTVWGMRLDTMNKLTVLNTLQYTDGRKNRVTIKAGDDDKGVAVIFTGDIVEAWADIHAAPEASFHVSAFSGVIQTLKPVSPTSYKGSVDVATVMGGIAAQMGLSLENSGVDQQIQSPYLAGSLFDQMAAVAAAADINYGLDEKDPVLAIWPRGKARNGDVIDVSPQTGLVGYPAFSQSSVSLTTIFNRSIVFGRKVKVTSDLITAKGEFLVARVAHNLDAEIPGGQWFTRVDLVIPGQATPILS